MKVQRKAIVAACLLAGNVAACGGSATTEAKAPDEGPLAGELVDAAGKPAPTWVTSSSSYKKDGEGNKVICGEGSIGSTANLNLAQSASADRARTALARSLDVKVKSMIKDYQATTTGGTQFKAAANDEQMVVDASKQITNTSLSGTEVSETWISKTSTLHSLVCLNVQKFKGVVTGMKELDEAIRQAVEQRAEKAWDEVDAIGTHPAATAPAATVAQ
jgi:hypothetical protein